MLLFHGSNQAIKNPKILNSKRALDFGSGFYLTSNKNQAARWAKAVTLRLQSGIPMLSIFEFNYNPSELKIFEFDSANSEWLDFIVKNRTKNFTPKNYDLIIGPVANDSTLLVINDYIDGRYTRSEAINHLLPQNLTDQFAF